MSASHNRKPGKVVAAAQKEEKEFGLVDPKDLPADEEFEIIPSAPKATYAAIVKEFEKRKALIPMQKPKVSPANPIQSDDSFVIIEKPTTSSPVKSLPVKHLEEGFQKPKRKFRDYVFAFKDLEMKEDVQKPTPKTGFDVSNPYEAIADVEATEALLKRTP